MELNCPVWVSRRWWPWPKKYRCKGMLWGADGVPGHVLMLILVDERRVFVDARGRSITYGLAFFEWQVAQASAEAGQPISVKSD